MQGCTSVTFPGGGGRGWERASVTSEGYTHLRELFPVKASVDDDDPCAFAQRSLIECVFPGVGIIVIPG